MVVVVSDVEPSVVSALLVMDGPVETVIEVSADVVVVSVVAAVELLSGGVVASGAVVAVVETLVIADVVAVLVEGASDTVVAAAVIVVVSDTDVASVAPDVTDADVGISVASPAVEPVVRLNERVRFDLFNLVLPSPSMIFTPVPLAALGLSTSTPEDIRHPLKLSYILISFRLTCLCRHRIQQPARPRVLIRGHLAHPVAVEGDAHAATARVVAAQDGARDQGLGLELRSCLCWSG